MRKIKEKILFQMLMNCTKFIFALVVMLLMTPFIINKLGIEEFGVWCMVLIIIGFFSLLDFGLGTAVVKCVASLKDKNQAQSRNEKLSTYALLYVVLAVIGSMCMYPIFSNMGNIFSLSPHYLYTAQCLLLILALRTFILALPLSLFRAILFGSGYISEISFVNILGTFIYASLAFVFIQLGYGIIYLGIANIVAVAIEYIIYILLAFRYLPDLKIKLSFVKLTHAKEITSLSIAAILIQVSGLIMLKTDPLIIKIFLSLTAVSLYSVALKITENFVLLIKQISHVLAPKFCELWQENNDNRQIITLYLSTTRHILAISALIASVIAIHSELFLTLWLGNEFNEAAPVLIILIASAAILAPQLVASDLLLMSGNHRTSAWIAALGLLMNLLLSIVLVKSMGITGVAVATLISMLLIGISLIFIISRKILKIKIAYLLRSAIIPALIPTLMFIGMSFIIMSLYSNLNIILFFSYNITVLFISLYVYWIKTLIRSERLMIINKLSLLGQRLIKTKIATDIV